MPTAIWQSLSGGGSQLAKAINLRRALLVLCRKKLKNLPH